MEDQLVETWNIHDRINRYLLQAIPEEALSVAMAPKHRTTFQLFANSGKVKGFKPHVTAFVGYLISHESHHRGQITWNLKNTGKPLDQKTSYGLWEWGVR